jgi:amino acid permease
MMRGVYVAYAIVAACYFPVAITGYWAFGNQVQDNILKSVGKPIWVVAMANLMVVVHVFAAYQVSWEVLVELAGLV